MERGRKMHAKACFLYKKKQKQTHREHKILQSPNEAKRADFIFDRQKKLSNVLICSGVNGWEVHKAGVQFIYR